MSNKTTGSVARALIVVLAATALGGGALAQKRRPVRKIRRKPAAAKPAPTPTPTPTQEPSPEPTLEPRTPNYQEAAPQPVPPLPDLTRLGIVSSNVMTLSVNDAIRRALLNNNDIEVSRDDVRISEQALRALYGFYDPLFSITPTYDKRTTPVTSTVAGGGSAGTVSSTTFTFSPAISKNFEKGGGSYSLSFNNQRQRTSASIATLNPFFSSSLVLSYNQPLLRNRSIDANRRAIRIQKKVIEQSDSDFRARTISIISQVQASYWNLVFALRNQQNQLESLNLSRQNMRNIEAQISAGAKAPLDRAQVLTDIANRESALFSATQLVSIYENALKQLMLKDPQVPDWSAQITPTDAPAFDLTPVDFNAALDEAHKNRPELRRLVLAKDINTIDLEYFKNQTRPQVDLTGFLASTGLAGTAGGIAVNPTFVGGYGRDLNNLFGANAREINIGVAIQLPIRNRTAKANLASARIAREQLDASYRSTDQIVEQDVRNAAQAVATAQQRVLSSRLARQSAEQQLDGEQKLYDVGRSTTFLLLQRQNELTAARTSELQAETDYNKALADLQRATSATLRVNNVVVENPIQP